MLLALVVATACGGTSKAPGAVASSPAGASPSATASPSASPSTRPTRPATSAPKQTPPKQNVAPSPSAAPKHGTSVWLDRACGRRGKDVQALNARTEPNGPVGFNTQYSDGSYYGDGTSQYSDGYSRAGNGFADSSGRFRASWTIPVNAPLGIAAVRIVTQDGPFELTFRIVATTGSCA